MKKECEGSDYFHHRGTHSSHALTASEPSPKGRIFSRYSLRPLPLDSHDDIATKVPRCPRRIVLSLSGRPRAGTSPVSS